MVTEQLAWGERKLLPKRRLSDTQKDRIRGFQNPVFTNLGYFEDGTPGEIFIDFGREGVELRDLAHAFALITSLALQYGCPPCEIAQALRSFKGIPSIVAERIGEGCELGDPAWE